eukprot:6171409-Amphidinium_carterae.2
MYPYGPPASVNPFDHLGDVSDDDDVIAVNLRSWRRERRKLSRLMSRCVRKTQRCWIRSQTLRAVMRICHPHHPQREISLLRCRGLWKWIITVDDPLAVTPDGNPLVDIPAPISSTRLGKAPPANYAVTLTRRLITHPARLQELGREEQALLNNIFVVPRRENALTHNFHVAAYYLVNHSTGLDLSNADHRLSHRWSCRYCRDNRGKPIDDPPRFTSITQLLTHMVTQHLGLSRQNQLVGVVNPLRHYNATAGSILSGHRCLGRSTPSWDSDDAPKRSPRSPHR